MQLENAVERDKKQKITLTKIEIIQIEGTVVVPLPVKKLHI
jgi:hypothetical protein